jgi:hypothetical protein
MAVVKGLPPGDGASRQHEVSVTLPSPQCRHQRFHRWRTRNMRSFLTAALIATSLSPLAFAQDTKIDTRIAAAHAVLHELMNTPD